MRTVLMIAVLILSLEILTGCVTTSAGEDSRYSQLKTRVGKLETRVQKLEKGQANLENMIVRQINAYSQEAEQKDKPVVKNYNPSHKEIQTALKNAGFYKGKIDGKIGAKTRNAIMEFQKKYGLKVDGIVGKNTWEILSEFLESE